MARRVGLVAATAVWVLAALMQTPGAGQQAGRAGQADLHAGPAFETSDNCLACHNGLTAPSGEDVSIGAEWRASMMANASRDRQTAENNPAASEETGEMGSGSEQASNAEGANSDMQMKMSREAAADPGAAKMTMGGAGAMGGDSRPGAGGNNGGQGQNQLDPLAIAQALRQEMLEASADTKGKNVEREDIRRKTEQGEATVGFTRVAPPSTLDRSRAQAPPVVPDARRALLFHYFIRQQ